MRVLLICGAILAFSSSVHSVPKCDGIWTRFYDRDDPSGHGDYELLSNLREKYPEICSRPSGIDVRLVHPLADGVDYWYLGGNIIDDKDMGPHIGFQCRNSFQKERKAPPCEDYKIRFCCKFVEPTLPKGYHWTQWFDRDDPSVTGDYETLKDLRKEYPNYICDRPKFVQARVVGSKAPWQTTGEKITINTHEGFYCKRKDQGDNQCHDYEVRFACPDEPPCPKGYVWTDYYDRDDPSVTGDYETIKDLRNEKKNVCERPKYVQARLVRSKAAWQTAGESVTINAHVGFVCKKKDQKDKACHDYEARFCCPPAPQDIASGWTGWFNVDKPSTGGGDFETISNIKARKRSDQRFCRSTPKKIQVVRAKDHKDPRKLGQVFYADPRYGFKCYNNKQRRGYSYAPAVCFDYKVRFFC